MGFFNKKGDLYMLRAFLILITMVTLGCSSSETATSSDGGVIIGSLSEAERIGLSRLNDSDYNSDVNSFSVADGNVVRVKNVKVNRLNPRLDRGVNQ